ncbi:MAG: ArnT family glycosyltransferase [Rhizobiaceae bacterium]
MLLQVVLDLLLALFSYKSVIGKLPESMMVSAKSPNYPFLLLLILGMIFLGRLISLWFNNSELFFDEAQYWFWAQELEFGYFSKPPLLAWIIAGTTSLCGSDSEFCVRLSAPILHIATAILVFMSGRLLFDARTGFWASLLYVTLPAVSLSSTIISTDVPLLFCWSLALYAYIRLRDSFTFDWALLLGVAIGLGLNAKYAMIYFVLCGLVHMLAEQQEYTPPRKSGFWIAVGIACLMLVPNILWNLDNGFVTVSHTGDNIGWTGFEPNWTGLAEFFGSQFGVFGPVAFGILIATTLKMAGDSISSGHRLLLSFSVPVILLIMIQALMSKAYANWAATAYIAASILVAEVMVNRIPWAWLRTSFAIHGVVFVAIAVAVCFAGPGQLVLPNGLQPFARTQGAALIAEAVKVQLDAYDYNGLITTDRKLSALMSYNLRRRDVSVHAWRHGAAPTDHFQLKNSFQESPRDPVLVVSRSDNVNFLSAEFETTVPLGVQAIPAGETEQIYFYRLEGHESFR